MAASFPTKELQLCAESLYAFEASASRAHTGTGSRREGSQFERLVADYWQALCNHLESEGASVERIKGPRHRHWARLSFGERSLYLPTLSQHRDQTLTAPRNWLALDFSVSELVASYPGVSAAVERYAPDSGPYANGEYPKMYERLKTKFDDTILFEEKGVLVNKTLFEYKTAKSSRGTQIDGNAHERLSFQIMQYLEVATRYPQCTFAVVTNGAFVRYRNKYHVNFHIQADRLAAFRWFSMKHYCTISDYARLANSMVGWLLGQTQ